MAKHQALISFLVLILAATFQATHGVDYTVTNNALSTDGGVHFRDEIGQDYAKQTMDAATQFIWRIFQENDPADRKDYQTVTLSIENDVVLGGQSVVAATSGKEIRYNGKTIGTGSDVKVGFAGVIYHEMTHVWQWNGNGQANGGLIEGIADYVRLKANYPASNWGKPGEGSRWDQGYDVTAYFLDYCNGLKNGFVADLNKLMRNGYSDQFFDQLLGKSVDQLWQDYKAKYGNTP